MKFNFFLCRCCFYTIFLWTWFIRCSAAHFKDIFFSIISIWIEIIAKHLILLMNICMRFPDHFCICNLFFSSNKHVPKINKSTQSSESNRFVTLWHYRYDLWWLCFSRVNNNNAKKIFVHVCITIFCVSCVCVCVKWWNFKWKKKLLNTFCEFSALTMFTFRKHCDTTLTIFNNIIRCATS